MRKDELIDALLAGDDPEEAHSMKNGSTQSGNNVSTTRSPKSVKREDVLKAAAVSPEWMRAEWMISETSIRRVESALGQHRRSATPVLRLYEITDDECQTHGRTLVGDTDISLETNEWFVRCR